MKTIFREGKLSGAALKYIAAATMLIDHITCGLLEVGRGADGRSLMFSVPGGITLDTVGRAIGRTAFPIFLFFVVEGYLYTRSRPRFLLNMLVFGALSHFPFRWLFYPRSQAPHTGTMITLALGMVAVWGIDMLSETLQAGRNFLPERYRRDGTPAQEPGKTAGSDAAMLLRTAGLLIGGAALTVACGYAARLAGSDYSYGGVMAVVLLYVFYRSRPAALLLTWCWLTWYNSSELAAIFGFVLLLCYNGTRGKQNKYFFYLFYPMHLLFLVLLRMALPFVH